MIYTETNKIVHQTIFPGFKSVEDLTALVEGDTAVTMLRSLVESPESHYSDWIGDGCNGPVPSRTMAAYQRGIARQICSLMPHKSVAIPNAGCSQTTGPSLSVEIKEYPNDIPDRLIRRVFEISTPYNGAVISALARLVCVDARLAVNTPCFDILANLALSVFDQSVAQYCYLRGFSYARNAGTIFFSPLQDSDIADLIEFCERLLARDKLHLDIDSLLRIMHSY